MKSLWFYEIKKICSKKSILFIFICLLVIPILLSIKFMPTATEAQTQKKHEGEINGEWMKSLNREETTMDNWEAKLIGNTVLQHSWDLYKEKQFSNEQSDSLMLPISVNDRGITENQAAYIAKQMEKGFPYTYGDHRGGDFIMWAFIVGSLSLGAFMVYLMSNLFNKENDGNLIEVMKTTIGGKKKLAVAKLLTALTIPLVVCTVSSLLYIFIGFLFFDFNSNVSIIVTQVFNPLSYGEAILYGVLFYFVGVCSLSIISSLLSLCLKSSYVSLGICIVLYLLPMLFTSFTIADIPIFLFAPSSFLVLTNTIFNSPFFFIGDQGYMYGSFIPIMWILIIMVFSFIIYKKYQMRVR